MTFRSPVRISTPRLMLLMPPPDAGCKVAEYFRENREHLGRWSPPQPANLDTAEFWERRLARSLREFADDRSMRLMLFRRDEFDGRVLGTLGYTLFVRGHFQGCQVGFGLDHRDQGNGFMSEALEAGNQYVFSALGMHRVAANYQPNNVRSARLLERCGFVIEGYARRYLFVAGEWRDHVLTALTNPKPEAPAIETRER